MTELRSPAFSKVLEELEKKGLGTLTQSTGKSDRRRIPTGIFNIDRPMGGGFPLSRIAIICGYENTYKTTLSLKVMDNYLRTCLECFLPQDICSCEKKNEMLGVYITTERGFDEGYISRLRMDSERVYIFKPAHGEAACEYAEKFAQVPEVGAIIVDSIANLLPEAELEKGYMDSQSRGLRARLVSRMCRAMVTHLDQSIPKIAIFINHLLPAMDGVGSYMPGGSTPRYLNSTVLKLWKTLESESRLILKKDEELDSEKRKQKFGFMIEKSRVSKSNISGEFQLFIEPHAEEKINYADANDWETVMNWAIKLGLLEREGNRYEWNGKTYTTQRALFSDWRTKREDYIKLQHDIIKATFHDQDN